MSVDQDGHRTLVASPWRFAFSALLDCSMLGAALSPSRPSSSVGHALRVLGRALDHGVTSARSRVRARASWQEMPARQKGLRATPTRNYRNDEPKLPKPP